MSRGSSLSSSDNPQFERPPLINGETPESVPSAPGVFALAGTAPAPAIPPPVENPVWNGWDVLLIAGLTLVTMFVLQSAVIVSAYFLTRPHVPLSELVQRPILLMLSQLL